MDGHGSLLTLEGLADMRKRVLAAAMFAALLTPAALAQTVPPPAPRESLTVAEAKAALFGIHLYGTTTDFGMKWDECIEPDGDTLYTTPEGQMHGRLTISPRGYACFAYEDTGFRAPQCFVVWRNKDGLALTSEFGGGEVFVTTKVVHGIRTCEKADLIG